MKQLSKKELLAEAKAQSRALDTIRKWLAAAIGISTVSVALIVFGFMGESVHMLIGIIGIVLLVLSAAAALLINLGLKRGAENVKNILAAAEDM